MDVRVDTLAADSGRITCNPEVILSWRYQGLRSLTYKIDLCLRQVAVKPAIRKLLFSLIGNPANFLFADDSPV
jgi:hypothetical protein